MNESKGAEAFCHSPKPDRLKAKVIRMTKQSEKAGLLLSLLLLFLFSKEGWNYYYFY
jgi:hypothetical protein